MIDDPSVPMSYDPSSPMDDEQTTPDGEREAELETGSSSDAQGLPTGKSEDDLVAPPSDSQDEPGNELQPDEVAPSTDSQDTQDSEPEAEPETTPSTDSQDKQRSEADSEPELAPLTDSQDMPSREPDPEPETALLTDAQDTPGSEPDPEPETTLLAAAQDTASSEPDSESETTLAADAQETLSSDPDSEPETMPSADAQDTPISEPDSEPAPAPSSEASVVSSEESDADLGIVPESDTQAEGNAGPGTEVKAKAAGVASSAADSVPDAEPEVMPLMGHLIELRKRLTWAVLALLISTGISFIFAKQVMIFLIAPMGDAMPQALKPTESLGNYMKVALICGVTLAMPVIVYQIGRFLAPGLTKQEKRWLFVLVPGATLCFIVGAAFAYFVMLPTAIPFLQGFMSDIIEEAWAIGEYLSFVTSLLLWIGLAFELPLFVFFLAKLGIINVEMLTKNRKYAYLGIAVAAAIITPTVDPLNMMLVMGPLLVLYELGVILARIA